MSIFECSQCGCIENTSLCDYWFTVQIMKKPPLCSECDPEIARWHGEFPKEKPAECGLITKEDGFLYPKIVLYRGEMSLFGSETLYQH